MVLRDCSLLHAHSVSSSAARTREKKHSLFFKTGTSFAVFGLSYAAVRQCVILRFLFEKGVRIGYNNNIA